MAFVKLQEENLGVPRPHPLLVLFRSSHPPLGDRIDFANAYRPWETGAPLRYDAALQGAPKETSLSDEEPEVRHRAGDGAPQEEGSGRRHRRAPPDRAEQRAAIAEARNVARRSSPSARSCTSPPWRRAADADALAVLEDDYRRDRDRILYDRDKKLEEIRKSAR